MKLEVYAVTVACYKTVYALAASSSDAMNVVEKNIHDVEFDPIEDDMFPEVDGCESYPTDTDYLDDDEKIATDNGWIGIDEIEEVSQQLAVEKEEEMLKKAGQQELPFED